RRMLRQEYGQSFRIPIGQLPPENRVRNRKRGRCSGDRNREHENDARARYPVPQHPPNKRLHIRHFLPPRCPLCRYRPLQAYPMLRIFLDTPRYWKNGRFQSRLTAMFSFQSRRNFLKTAAAGTVGLGLCRNGFAQGTNTQITATKLGDNYTLLSGAGSNVLVLTGPDGVLMVDGGLAEHSSELLKAVTGLSPQGRVQALFNTHWHM